MTGTGTSSSQVVERADREGRGALFDDGTVIA
jgi:hypothetical protein